MLKKIMSLACAFTIVTTIVANAVPMGETAKFKFSANGFRSSFVPKTMELEMHSDEILPCYYGEFPDVIAEPQGYDFVGWSLLDDTRPDEVNKIYYAGDWIENFVTNKTHRFYAVWEREE